MKFCESQSVTLYLLFAKINKHDTAFAKHVIHVLYSQLETDN